MDSRYSNGPHQGQPVLFRGLSVDKAKAIMVMVHGRDGSADDILLLSDSLDQFHFAYVAIQAAQNTWYPNSFLAAIPDNEPGISSGLLAIDDIVNKLFESGIGSDRIILLGFSQGACLMLDYVVRHPRKFGGIIGLSGGLIGPKGTPRKYTGSMDGTPVFLGCSDNDIHIPKERVNETAEVFDKLDASVTKCFYPNMGHTINEDEIIEIRKIMNNMIADMGKL